MEEVLGKVAMLAMEKDFDAKLRIQPNSSNGGGGNVHRSKSFAFRAPQENFTVHDFELGKIYGVGSYSKAQIFFSLFSGVSNSVPSL